MNTLPNWAPYTFYLLKEGEVMGRWHTLPGALDRAMADYGDKDRTALVWAYDVEAVKWSFGPYTVYRRARDSVLRDEVQTF